jgi:RNA polymerase sigma factor (TIGR02999 family)
MRTRPTNDVDDDPPVPEARPSPGPDITQLLRNAETGDPHAAAALLPLVYEQLRRLARRNMRGERPDQTLQATALVHEAYLRLVGDGGGGGRNWDHRWHFFAAAAEAMRRILVDHARRRSRLKRGGGGRTARRVDFEEATLAAGDPPEELLALDEALTALCEVHPEKGELVKLRYFAGLTQEEAAQALGVSVATAERHWAYARAWLFRNITGGDRAPGL